MKFFIALLFVPLISIAKDSDSQIIDDVSVGFVTCSAFYSIIEVAAKNSEKPDLEKHYNQLGINAYSFSLELAKNDRTEEMANKVTASRLTLFFKSMITEIDSNFKNISVLMSQHLDPCTDMMKKPVDYLENKLKK